MIALQMKISKNESASYDQSTGYKQHNTKEYDEDEWYGNEEYWNEDDDWYDEEYDWENEDYYDEN